MIESAASETGKAHVIKSHHNVGGLPEDMELGLVEPLRELFKDEVRRIGLQLGLPYDMLYRHPFPGPGLGVRVLGEVKKSTATSCAVLMLSLSKSCTKRICTIKSARHSLSSCRCVLSVSWATAVNTTGLSHCAQSKPSTL